MYFYFSSGYPAVIKINGIYYGQITDTVKQIDLTYQEPPFIEVCSLSPTEKSVFFILDDGFLSSPPPSVTITDLKGGYLIKFTPSYFQDGFKVISQERFNDSLVTVFCENGFKISIETNGDFYAETLKFEFSDLSVERVELFNTPFVFVRFKGKTNLLSVYKINGNIYKVFSREVADYSADGRLTTTENLLDMAKHKRVIEWNFNGESFVVSNCKISKNPDFNPFSINEKLIPFTFIEELGVGGDIFEYLNDNVRENADKLKGYFGDFVGVMPPPTFRAPDQVGLVYKRTENLFFVRYFTFELVDKKISNVKEV